MISISEQQLELYMSLFSGRTDVYARHWEKEGRSGYSPAYEFNWDEFMAHKGHGGSMKDFENKKLIPLTKEVVKKHLLGQHRTAALESRPYQSIAIYSAKPPQRVQYVLDGYSLFTFFSHWCMVVKRVYTYFYAQ